MSRYVIPPRLTLPDRHVAVPVDDDDDPITAYVPTVSTPTLEEKPMGKAKTSCFRSALAFIRFLLCSGIALVVGYAIWEILAPWTIYRIVAFVVLVIMWANCASATVRKRGLTTMGKIAKRHRALTMNTMAYLAAIRKEDLKP